MRGWEGVRRARRALAWFRVSPWDGRMGCDLQLLSLLSLTRSLARSLTFFYLISLSGRLALASRPVRWCPQMLPIVFSCSCIK